MRKLPGFLSLLLLLLIPLQASLATSQSLITVEKTVKQSKKVDRSIDIQYPTISSKQLNVAAINLNHLIEHHITNIIDRFNKQANPDSRFSNTLTARYDLSQLSYHRDTIISICFETEYFTGGAHPSHEIHTLNYNMSRDKLIYLEELFKPDAPYLKVIADYSFNALKAELKKRGADPNLIIDWIQEGTAAKTENYQNWQLQKNGILFHFDEYQVAAYVYGQPTVLVPFSVLKPILVQ